MSIHVHIIDNMASISASLEQESSVFSHHLHKANPSCTYSFIPQSMFPPLQNTLCIHHKGIKLPLPLWQGCVLPPCPKCHDQGDILVHKKIWWKFSVLNYITLRSIYLHLCCASSGKVVLWEGNSDICMTQLHFIHPPIGRVHIQLSLDE